MKSYGRKVKPYAPADDGWSGAAKEGSDRMIRGQLLRFVDGPSRKRTRPIRRTSTTRWVATASPSPEREL
jgi:hypothetical protein